MLLAVGERERVERDPDTRRVQRGRQIRGHLDLPRHRIELHRHLDLLTR